jgi:hypothetical protein
VEIAMRATWTLSVSRAPNRCYCAKKEAVASGSREIAAQGTADMEDHETRRKIIRQWMALPKDKRQTADQAAAFAKRAVEQNKFQRSSREPYDRIMGWLLSRVGRS